MANPDTITYAAARTLLIAMLKKHLKKNGRYSNLIFSGFNCGFDSNFVKAYLLPDDEFEQYFHYKFRDVMGDIECLKFYGWLPNECGKLTQCADYFGVAQGTAHTAKDDILMTIAVQLKVKELMDSKKSGGQAVDLISLLEAE
jgi:oligoribonuclease (3'-5' exoribonuclease)